MDIGVGLPTCVPGCPPELLTGWAASADQGPFASVGTVDRLLYGNHDPLLALAAAASVTERVQLVSSILIAPLREEASLAKQVATLDALSAGRVVLGVGVGARQDDYDASETPYAGRGERLDRMLAGLRDRWEDGRIGPAVASDGGPLLLGGGQSGAALARMARHTGGYIHSGGPPRAFAAAAASARAAWADAGRPGEPQLWGMAYYALGDEAVEAGRDYLLDYYGFTGPFARRIAAGLLATPLAVRELCEGYADAGCDHIVLFPTVASPDQLDRLAATVDR